MKTCEMWLKTCLGEKFQPQMHILENVERHKIKLSFTQLKKLKKKERLRTQRNQKTKRNEKMRVQINYMDEL